MNPMSASQGKAGKDLFSRQKELTVVMVPYERFSVFPKAVDSLYKSAAIPLNLVVVAGNPPESVQAALEKRQRQHENLLVIYSKRQPSVYGALNLAIPHLQTPYVFFMDNEVRITGESLDGLLKCAAEKGSGIVCPKNSMVTHHVGENGNGNRNLESLGIRTCFLISQSALEKMGKFDEEMNPLTGGIDITLQAQARGIPIQIENSASIECEGDHPLNAIDQKLYSLQWNIERIERSLQRLEDKWGVRLQNDASYMHWLQSKARERQAAEIHNMAYRIKKFLALFPSPALQKVWAHR